MAIIRWKGKLYSVSVAWPLVLLGLMLLVGLSLPLIQMARDFFVE